MAINASGIAKAIILGNRLAISLAKTCITTPVLINTDPEQGAKYAIPLLCETNQKSAAAEVSESLIISTDAKKNVTDNVAPGSKSWHLTGYLHVDGEVTNYFTPLLQFQCDTLWSWFNHGAVLMYKDGNAQIYDRVVIKDLQTSQQKDSGNAIPFSLTLKEINVMETSPLESDTGALDSAATPDQISASVPKTGSSAGFASAMGSTNSVMTSSLADA